MKLKNLIKELTPTQVIIFGFIGIILVGTFLLCLPISNNSDTFTPILTALFTSTSAVCVTGLVLVNTLSYWSLFGKIVILILIQIGGLGFMAIITMIYLLFRRRISLRSRLIIQESFNQPSFHGMVALVRKAIKGTLIIEAICAILLTLVFLSKSNTTPLKSLFWGIFHSVSAFCNAGFDIIGDSSLTGYVHNPFFNFIIMFLIVSGGIGFAIWVDLLRVFNFNFLYVKANFVKKCKKLTLHSKIALTVTVCLIFLGGFIFLILEYSNPLTIGTFTFNEKLLASFFHSVSLRTAGFNTISMGDLRDTSKLISVFYMLIGGSPGGTAGGLKTVTFAIVILTVYSVMKGQTSTVVFNRTIPVQMLRKALSVTIIYIIIFFIATFLLMLIEEPYHYSFLDIAFEVSSALGTVGLTTGLTPDLSTLSKLVIIFCMFIGRLGPISIGVALTTKLTETNNSLEYVEENVLVG
ncbi:MAG: TrkH family potassium uptake protein [Lachnospirales bacterium]